LTGLEKNVAAEMSRRDGWVGAGELDDTADALKCTQAADADGLVENKGRLGGDVPMRARGHLYGWRLATDEAASGGLARSW